MGELGGPADGGDEGPEEGTLLKGGLLEGDDEGSVEGAADGP